MELPLNAENLLCISFLDDVTRTTDTTCVYTIVDALQTVPKSEDSGPIILYNQDLIYDMLTHSHMFIEYIETGKTNNIRKRWHSAHLSLNKFPKQFFSVLEMLEDKTE
jgi:hypothetical protein